MEKQSSDWSGTVVPLRCRVVGLEGLQAKIDELNECILQAQGLMDDIGGLAQISLALVAEPAPHERPGGSR